MAKRGTPKWREEWDRLVGSNEYLAIKNFDKYQALTSAGIPVAQWIKDFVEKDFEETELTGLERWLLDSLRRWRGRRGANLPADVTPILSATCAHSTDRPHLPEALCRLITRGFLIPCNERAAVPKKIQEEKNQEEKQESFNPNGYSSKQERSKPSGPGGLSPKEKKRRELLENQVGGDSAAASRYCRCSNPQRGRPDEDDEDFCRLCNKLILGLPPETNTRSFQICDCPDDVATDDGNGVCRFCRCRIYKSKAFEIED
jgi:hypothetical protein